jgi:hypothetical protein
MWRILKALAAAAVARLARDYRRLSVEMLKIQAVRWYVQGVAGARLAFIVYLSATACLLLAAVGFVFLHVGVFMLLPLCPQSKAILLLLLGLVYLAISLAALRRATSQSTWMKLSKADELVAKVTGVHGPDLPTPE